jgi:hypothetical protein
MSLREDTKIDGCRNAPGEGLEGMGSSIWQGPVEGRRIDGVLVWVGLMGYSNWGKGREGESGTVEEGGMIEPGRPHPGRRFRPELRQCVLVVQMIRGNARARGRRRGLWQSSRWK